MSCVVRMNSLKIRSWTFRHHECLGKQTRVIYLDMVVILKNLLVLWEVQLIEPAFDIHLQLVEQIRRNVCNNVVTARALASYLCS